MDPVVGMYSDADAIQNTKVALYVCIACACGWTAHGVYRRVATRNDSGGEK